MHDPRDSIPNINAFWTEVLQNKIFEDFFFIKIFLILPLIGSQKGPEPL